MAPSDPPGTCGLSVSVSVSLHPMAESQASISFVSERLKSDSYFQQSGFPRAFGIGLASGFAGRDKFLSVFGLGSTEYGK